MEIVKWARKQHLREALEKILVLDSIPKSWRISLSILTCTPSHLHRRLQDTYQRSSWVEGLRRKQQFLSIFASTPHLPLTKPPHHRQSPQPPPRVAQREQVSLAGVLEPVLSTIRTMDLPPATTETAREGIRLCAGLRRHYLFSTGNDVDDTMTATTLEMLTGLIAKAKEACNIRDYVTLLIEDTVLRLSMDLSPPTKALRDVARFVNPFLNSEGPQSSTTTAIEPFRATDAALITDTEKDLLVLLYYCHESNIKGSPDEAIGHLCKLASKYGDVKDLDVRKEPFTETEVSVPPTGGFFPLTPIESTRWEKKKKTAH